MLQEALDQKGWNQKQLESASGISQGTISNYLRGVRKPTGTQLQILATALGVGMEWLVTGHNPTGEELFDDDGEKALRLQVSLADKELPRLLQHSEEIVLSIRREAEILTDYVESLLIEAERIETKTQMMKAAFNSMGGWVTASIAQAKDKKSRGSETTKPE